MGEETPGKVRTEDGIFLSVKPTRYYLYFAHHKGSYIRLAYGDAVAGPWTVYEPGVLSLEVAWPELFEHCLDSRTQAFQPQKKGLDQVILAQNRATPGCLIF